MEKSRLTSSLMLDSKSGIWLALSQKESTLPAVRPKAFGSLFLMLSLRIDVSHFESHCRQLNTEQFKMLLHFTNSEAK